VPPRSPELNPLNFYLRRHEKELLVLAAPVDSAKVCHHRIVDACKTIPNCPVIFERMLRSTMKPVEACIETH
jgi:hypothetical protein